jgi:hypothetical protein
LPAGDGVPNAHTCVRYSRVIKPAFTKLAAPFQKPSRYEPAAPPALPRSPALQYDHSLAAYPPGGSAATRKPRLTSRPSGQSLLRRPALQPSAKFLQLLPRNTRRAVSEDGPSGSSTGEAR